MGARGGGERQDAVQSGIDATDIATARNAGQGVAVGLVIHNLVDALLTPPDCLALLGVRMYRIGGGGYWVDHVARDAGTIDERHPFALAAYRALCIGAGQEPWRCGVDEALRLTQLRVNVPCRRTTQLPELCKNSVFEIAQAIGIVVSS